MADDFPQIADLVADALDLSGSEISNILDATPFLARTTFVSSSNGDTHKYITNTSLPAVGFISETGGREFDHDVDTPVTVTLKNLDYSSAVRKGVADTWKKGGAVAYVARLIRKHLKSAMVTLEKQMLNNTDSSNGFAGLAGLSSLDAAADEMVVDAGGTTADTASSVYLIHEGELGYQGVYCGDGPSLTLGDTIVQNMTTSGGLNYPAYYTPGSGLFAAQNGGAYTASRICNLTADSGKGLTDDLIGSAFELHPIGQQPTVIVMNRRSREQLRKSRTATNATGAPAPTPDNWEGVPIVTTDQLLNTEALLS